MNTARRGLRKLALLAHVTCSVGWLGAVLGFLPLVVAGLSSDDQNLARGAYMAADLLVRSAILPLALASVVTGVLSSLVSTWGLVRHHWVITKLVLTIIATAVLLLQIEPIGAAAELAGTSTEPLPRAVGLSMLVHTIGGVVVLLVITAIAVYKPQGTTRFATRTTRRDRRRSVALS